MSMSDTIDFGIDLGTTNSAIAQFRKGEVEVFRNPILYGQSTLPSVVGFRKDKIEVGSKAREYAQRRPRDVFSAFKRKMGTSETFHVECIDRSVTPVELSGHVLKALKGFVTSGAVVDAAVITIPASFDTSQSTATMKAAGEAGIRDVILLQEPIAASLAYANKSSHGGKLNDGKWLVYDLGGGTFDVALVETTGSDMRVLDHEGDNFLGGVDFDRLIVEKFLVPQLEKLGSFEDLIGSLRRDSGERHVASVKLLQAAEEAKIALSGTLSTDVAVTITDDEGEDIDTEITLTRSDLESLVREPIDQTIQMVRRVLTRNNLAKGDLQLILLVGGSTYMPCVRQRLEEVMGVPVSADVDPTTAIAVGAAYYAGGRQRRASTDVGAQVQSDALVKARAVYHRTSKEEFEPVIIVVEGQVEGLSYRVTRDDGGYDSGIKKVSTRILEDVPLVANAYNYFTVAITDGQGNLIPSGIESIGIAHGKYTVAGQPLPEAIGLEQDDLETQETQLTQLFKKNAILPLRAEKEFPLNRTLKKGSADAIRIRVMEGPESATPDSVRCIGHLEIKGTDLTRDAVRGSSLEVTIELSESRTLTARAFLESTGQEFTGVYDPKERSVPASYVQERADDIAGQIVDEITSANENEQYELAAELKALQREAQQIEQSAAELDDADRTDQRYQVEDRLSKLHQRLEQATKDRKLVERRAAFRDAVEMCSEVVNAHGNDSERELLDTIVSEEDALLSNGSLPRLREKIDELNGMRIRILWRTPKYLTGMFAWLVDQEERMNDPSAAQTLLAAGRDAIHHSNWSHLADVCMSLFDHLPRGERVSFSGRIGF